MKLRNYFKQQNDLEIVFAYRTSWDFSRQDVYLCPCGELMELHYGVYDPLTEVSCPNCQKAITLPLNVGDQTILLNLRARTILEKATIRAVSETCLAIDCYRLDLPEIETNHLIPTIQSLLDQPFECYETIYHHLDGRVEFEHEDSYFSSTAIQLADVQWKIQRSSSSKDVRVVSFGIQPFEGQGLYYTRSRTKDLYLGALFDRPTNGSQSSLTLFTIEKEPEIETHPVWRRHAFYHLDFNLYIQSIGQMVHLFYYLNRLIEQYPIFEQLTKGGYAGIVSDWVIKLFISPDKRYQVYKYLNNHTKESKIIGLPTYMRKYLKEYRASYETYQKWVQIQREQPLSEELFEDYLAIESQLDLKRVWRLIQKQQLTLSEIIQYVQHCEARQAVPMDEALRLWDEALAWSTKHQMPMKKFPNSIRLAHDRAKALTNETSSTTTERTFSEQVKVYQACDFKDEDLGYAIYIPKTPNELRAECQALGRYPDFFIKDFLTNKAITFIMRSLDDANQPYSIQQWEVKSNQLSYSYWMDDAVKDWNAFKFLKAFEQDMIKTLMSN